MSQCRPFRWLLWGILPIVLIAVFVIYNQHDLMQRAAALKQTGKLVGERLSSATPALGRQLGALGGLAAPERAVETMRQIWLSHRVSSQAKAATVPEDYSWWVSQKGDEIRLKGSVPSENDRRTIVGLVKARLPGTPIDDRMQLAPGAPNLETWFSAISFALAQVVHLQEGTVRLDGTTVTMFGEARSVADYHMIEQSAANSMPKGVTLANQAVLPPKAAPFLWTANFTNGTVTLSGHVPSERVKTSIIATVREYFDGSTVADRMVIASGEPEGFSSAVQTALRQLSRLKQGALELSDIWLTIRGTADNQRTANDIAGKFRSGLPARFRYEEEIKAETASPDAGTRRTGFLQFFGRHGHNPNSFALQGVHAKLARQATDS